MSTRTAPAPVFTVVSTVAVMVAAMIVAAIVASDVVAQTPPSSTAAPKALPRSFATPNVAKTAPMKQTKSCSSYGEGFVNVPGTDTCIKAGGYMRTDAGVNH
jgi:Porin subfamily